MTEALADGGGFESLRSGRFEIRVLQIDVDLLMALCPAPRHRGVCGLLGSICGLWGRRLPLPDSAWDISLTFAGCGMVGVSRVREVPGAMPKVPSPRLFTF